MALNQVPIVHSRVLTEVWGAAFNAGVMPED